MSDENMPSVTQADKCLIWDVRQSESTEEAWDYAARHREQSTTDLRKLCMDLEVQSMSYATQADELRAENERLREAMQSSLDQLDWINAQAENAMATSAGAATASGDSDGSLEMLNSIASDIGINAMMIRDKLSAALSTQTSAEASHE